MAWHELELPPREPVLVPPPAALDPRVWAAAQRATGVDALFSHQAEAVESLLDGQDTILATGTSSGKTLAFGLPAMQFLLKEPAARVLLIYPTKALAQDQLGRLEALSPLPDIFAAVYDGDTPKKQRGPIRSQAQLVLTNPDMLHSAILPYSDLWRRFLKSLRLIVVDEAHAFRGVFGCHCAWVLRRLLRVCEWLGSRPVVAMASATIPNASEHFEVLTGRTPMVVGQDGSMSAPRRLYVVAGPAELDARLSRSRLAAGISAGLASSGYGSLVFCRARSTAEQTAKHAKGALARNRDEPSMADCYRAGYTPAERRRIEKAVRSGRVLSLATTSALEVGVDLGSLRAVIINGHPGSVASFWQQAGRCGRGGMPGSIVFLAHEDPLEQHLARDPSLLASGAERVVASLENVQIAEAQLKCAAYERAISQDEAAGFGEAALAALDGLRQSGEFAQAAGRWFYASDQSPSASVSLRGGLGRSVRLIAGHEDLGTVEEWRALMEVYPGAIYLHRGQAYSVASLDLAEGAAILEHADPRTETEAKVQSFAEETVRIKTEGFPGGRISFGGFQITMRVAGCSVKDADSGMVLEQRDLTLPAHVFQTSGCVVDFGLEGWEEDAGAPVVHAVQHALISAAPLVCGCDPRDIGSVWFATAIETMEPRIVVYDQAPGGVGLAAKLYECSQEWLMRAWRMLDSCPCPEGCPRCLLLPRCEDSNEGLNKAGALEALGRLAAGLSGLAGSG